MRIAILIGLLSLVSTPSFSVQYRRVAINPKTYTSPSGNYQLRVNPDNRDASTGAKYRLTRDGTVLWEKHFPFALLEAGINDEGIFGGYAELGSGFKPGELIIAIGRSDGEIALRESHKRKDSLILHAAPTPLVSGLIFHPDQGRMIIRVWTGDDNDRLSEWWTYSLSDAKPGPKLKAEQYMPDSVLGVIDARPVPGTTLTLVSWWHFDGKVGGIITLVDSNAKPVWQLDLKGDYEVGKDEFERAEAVSEFQRKGSILGIAKRQFDILLVQKNEVATYQVESDGQGWKVAEVARKPFVPKASSITYPPVPEKSLELIRKWTIPLGKLPVTAIHSVQEFELVGKDKIAVLRHGETPALVLADRSGNNETTIELPMLREGEFPGNHLTWMGATKFVVTDSPKDRNKIAKAWLVDVATKNVRVFAELGRHRVAALASSPDGGIVLLANNHSPYTSEHFVASYGSNGLLKWERSSAGGYSGKPDELLSPEDISVDSKGKVIVLNNISDSIQIFSAEGKYASTLKIAGPKGVELRYPTQIRCIGTGYLIWDMEVAYQYDSNGKLLKETRPRFKNSKPVDSMSDPQLDAEGRVWLGDYTAIYRLNSLSVVDLTLGQVGELTGLKEIEGVLVTEDGATLARDKTSEEVHVFSPAGVKVRALLPSKTDLENSPDVLSRHGELKVDDLGRTYVNRASGYVRYSASGQREAVVQTKGKGGPPPAVWKVGWWWNGRTLMDSTGNTVTEIERLPSEEWMDFFDDTVVVAPNGEIAILAFDGFPSAEGPVKVGFYGRTGSPKHTAQIQVNGERLWQFAYDGTILYFARDKDILAVDKQGVCLWRFQLPQRKGAYWQVFSSKGGLAVFDGIDTVSWYAIPK